MKQARNLVALLVLLGCAGSEEADRRETASPSPALQVVHEQMGAFNRHDVAAMVARVAPDFVWFSVAGDEIAVDVRGREAFAESMHSYFASLPSVRSEIEESLVLSRGAPMSASAHSGGGTTTANTQSQHAPRSGRSPSAQPPRGQPPRRYLTRPNERRGC